jgi:OPT family oligopeptide transporter
VTPPAGAAVQSPPEPITTTPAPLKLEATARALITGGVIGVLLAAGNVYTAFKVSIIDGGNITAALLGFSLFATFRRLGRKPYGALENNITQTTAASAALMSFVTGVVGPIPALALMGTTYPAWAIMSWGAAVGVFGVFVGALLRQRLIVDENLPFATGRATGELIETINTSGKTAVTRTRLLLGVAIVAAAVTWFRDARPAFIPQATMFPGAIAGMTAAALSLGMSWSPLMLSTGVMLGLGTATSMLIGGALARGVLAPWLHARAIVATTDFGAFNSWLVWPALGLLIAGSFIPLLVDAGAIGRSVRDLVALARRTATGRLGHAKDPSLSFRLWGPLLAVSLVVLIGVGASALGVPPLVTLMALGISMFLANVSARAAGETDFAPAGSAGTVTLMALRNQGMANSVLGGSIALGMSSQVAGTLWGLRAGYRLGASPKAQVVAQILGALLGAAVVVPVYHLIAGSAVMGSEKMPAIAALSFKATAEAVSGGLSVLPRDAGTALALALAVGSVLTVLARTRFGRWMPSSAAIGCGMMLPFSSSLAIVAGACVVLLARRARPSFDEPSALAMAAGGIAGESVMGVIIAALLALGSL